MLKADISSADIVILASLCWDESTKSKVSQKLARELPDGSLIVDYSSDSFLPYKINNKNHVYKTKEELEYDILPLFDEVLYKYLNCVYSTSDLSGILPYKYPTKIDRSKDDLMEPHYSFQLIQILMGQTSWSSEQSLYLYRYNKYNV